MADKKGTGIKKLTPKMEEFIHHYLICRNGTEAAKRAGYAKSGAQQEASRLLLNAVIREEINKQRERLKKKFDIKKDDIVAEAAHIAFARPKDFLNWKTKMLEPQNPSEPDPETGEEPKVEARSEFDMQIYDSDDLEEGMDAAIKKVKKVCTDYGINLEVEFHGKVESLKLLAEMLGFIGADEGKPPGDSGVDHDGIREAIRRVKKG